MTTVLTPPVEAACSAGCDPAASGAPPVVPAAPPAVPALPTVAAPPADPAG
ncbi:hypothetical protein GTU99_22425 [Streptomyces sp. PRKS01-65]|nr:hypothetical protein [Streptomyces harenosi]